MWIKMANVAIIARYFIRRSLNSGCFHWYLLLTCPAELASKKRCASCALRPLWFWSRIFVLDNAKIMQKKEGPWFWKFRCVIKPSRAVCLNVSLFWNRLSAPLLVADQFKQSWRHAKAVCPPVRLVYKIVSSASTLVKYNAYRWVIDAILPWGKWFKCVNPPRDVVEARGKFASSGRSKGNENRRWHGTLRTCNLGDKDQTQLCSSSQCSLCSIIRNSFDVSVCKANTGWSRWISFFCVASGKPCLLGFECNLGSVGAFTLPQLRQSRFRPLFLPFFSEEFTKLY